MPNGTTIDSSELWPGSYSRLSGLEPDVVGELHSASSAAGRNSQERAVLASVGSIFSRRRRGYPYWTSTFMPFFRPSLTPSKTSVPVISGASEKARRARTANGAPGRTYVLHADRAGQHIMG